MLKSLDVLIMTIYGYLARFYVNMTGCRIIDRCEFKHRVSTSHDPFKSLERIAISVGLCES